jgi:Fe-S-cluster-containing dehydrogenase component
MLPGFHFNLNQCVACHACVVACQIENGGEVHVPWREVSTFNSHQHPELPVFYYSLACNHCEEAPCLSNCPALAYTKDEGLNAIVHHADRCIGCKYCTWACPYDAPKFVRATGVVEKCTACLQRLKEGKKPACANLCPTGALDYREIVRKEQHRIPGFTETGIGPGIELVSLRNRKPPRSVIQLDEGERKQFESLEMRAPTKVSLKKEWVLVLFTLLVPVLTGLITASSLGWIELNPFVFLAAGFAGLILSSVHLGRKGRAWRSVMNLKNSWLSREILGTGLFLGTAAAWFLFPDYRVLAFASAVLGFATSYIIDKVYLHFEKSTRLDVQSNSVFLTALLLTSLMTFNERYAALILLIKLLLYLYRKIYFLVHKRKVGFFLSAARILAGFVLPAWMWYTLRIDPWWITGVILAGELTDRAEFYLEGEVVSPRRQIIRDLKNSMK